MTQTEAQNQIAGHTDFSGRVARAILVAAAYFGAAKAGLAFAVVHASITAIWPPSGIALASLYLLGLWAWPGILAGAFLANYSQGTPLVVSFSIACGNTLAAVVGGRLLRGLPDFRPEFSRIRDVFLFALVGVALDPVVSASLGVLSLYLGGLLEPAGIQKAWIGWWGGDAIGVLILTPALIVIFTRAWRWPPPLRMLEALLLGAANFAFAVFVFNSNEAFVFLVYPLSVWAAIRFRHLGVMSVALALAGVSVPMLIYNGSLAGGMDKNELLFQVYRLQLFLSTSAMTGMLLAADIISRTRAEEHLVEKESAARAKDQFIATLSHELRTPLTSILAWAQLIKAGKLDEPTKKIGLQAIEDCALTQNQLINDLLDVSRIVTGKMMLNRQRVKAHEVLRSALDAIRPSAQKKKIEILDRGEAGGFEVLADPVRLKQVLWNLLANAVKFTPEAGRIEVSLDSRDGRMMRFRVTDSGEGIAPEVLPLLFRRFSQGDSSNTRAHGGLGLGLSLVRSLLELQGGSVEAESGGAGKGSTFTALLPLLEKLDRQESALPVDKGGDMVGAGPLKGWKILFVDDEPHTREAIRAALTSAGALVRVAASAAEASGLLAEEMPDVLLCDIAMPQEDGIRFLRRLRASDDSRLRALPALAFSASASPETTKDAERAGFQAHLAKPVENSVLVSAILSLG